MRVAASGILILMVFAIAGLVARRSRGLGGIGGVYYLRKSLFTPAERSFFGVLEALAIPGITLMAKVRLADIFGTVRGLGRGARQGALNRISNKHVDFLLIRKTDGKPILGIELDDSSHEEEGRVARDSFVNEVFASAGIPILHIPARPNYNPAEIRQKIDDAMADRG